MTPFADRTDSRAHPLLWLAFLALLIAALGLAGCATAKTEKVWGPDGQEWRNPAR